VAVGRCHRHWSRGESGVSPLNARQGIIRIGAQLSDGGRILVEVPPSGSECIQPFTHLVRRLTSEGGSPARSCPS